MLCDSGQEPDTDLHTLTVKSALGTVARQFESEGKKQLGARIQYVWKESIILRKALRVFRGTTPNSLGTQDHEATVMPKKELGVRQAKP